MYNYGNKPAHTERSAAMMNPGTSVVFLPCSDIRKTEHFYHDILGFPVVQRQTEDLAIFDTGYGYWGFCRYADGRPLLSGPRGVCLSINLESNEAVLEAYEKYKDLCPVSDCSAGASSSRFPERTGITRNLYAA